MSNKYPGGIITSGANAGYSVFFDGTGDYLSEAYNAWMNFGTADFTVECWVYPTSLASASAPFNFSATSTSVNSDVGWTIYVGANNSGNEAGFYSGSTKYAVTGWSLTANQWQHIALVRGSGSLKFYINGTQVGSTVSANVSVNSNAAWEFRIGNYSNNSTRYWNGYISNFRAVPGTAVYTSTFTPPTQLLAVTNTSLLTCNSPAIVDQSSNNFTITANGNAAVSTFTPFVGTQLVPNPNTLANTQGVWSISDAAYWMSQNKWPMPPNYPLQSLRFNSADSAYLNRTPASAGNRKTFTISFWVKRVKLGVAQKIFGGNNDTSGSNQFNITFQASDTISLFNSFTYPTRYEYETTQVFRDVSAWYHFVFAVDTTQASSSNRVKIYVNGSQITTFSVSVDGGQNTDWQWNSNVVQGIGAYVASVSQNYSDVYFADIINVDGQALTPSSFGANDPNTGVWSPVPYSGTYGTNGFRLSFQDNTGTTATTLGKDYSGNGNNWTPNNFSVAAGSGNDSLTDGPTNWGIDYGNGGEVRGNYATFNSIDNIGSATFSDGNLQIVTSSTNVFGGRATMSVSSGKWYWEMTPTSNVTAGECAIGIDSATSPITSAATGIGFTATSYSYRNSGLKVNNSTGTSYGASYTNNDVIGVALDLDAGTLVFYKNGVSQGTAFSSLSGSFTPAMSDLSGGNGTTLVANFGQRPFAYPAPSGFKVLCTTNLPIPTVGATSTTQADDYFNIALYTGNGTAIGSGGKAVTGLGFQPDFVWIKGISGATDHSLFDAVRGTTKLLESNTTDAESTQSESLTTFGSNGFTVGSLAQVNTNTATYVGWSWKANGAGVSNNAGSISSTVSANTTAGFSVVTYTGNGSASATVGHGLGVAPKMIIVKSRSNAYGWNVYHSSLGAGAYINLNATTGSQSSTTPWANTSPASTVFTIGTTGTGWNNENNVTYVAYCFAEIAGFSKFGSYTGNASTDGPFVYCGFRPKYIMIKNSSALGSWWIEDSSRSAYNVGSNKLAADSSAAENTGTANFDFLSNGFKVRNSGTELNGSGNTIIFMAFAESPFNYSRAR